MPKFQNRELALETLCNLSEENILINIYSEPGIGKTVLLQEVERRLKQQYPSILVIWVDLRTVEAKPKGQRAETLLSMIRQGAEGTLEPFWGEPNEAAGQLVGKFSQLAEQRKVLILVDNTEAVQEDRDFWLWLEATILSPLLIEGQIHHIYAGRIPVRWHRLEIRRVVKSLPLDPLPDNHARELVREQIIESNPELSSSRNLDEMVAFVTASAFGQPLLLIKIAKVVAERWAEMDLGELQISVYKDVIQPYINDEMFNDVEEPWKQILWWMSILDWFDSMILQRFLQQVAPELLQGRPEIYIIQNLSRLRTTKRVIWAAGQGDGLYGVIGEITRCCMMVLDPERYRFGCQVAQNIFNELASELSTNDDDIESYRRFASQYQERASQEELS